MTENTDPEAVLDESPPAVAEPALVYRSRLLEGMASCVEKKGFVDTTVADIVREAGVSKRTFYEHYSTKAECLIALYHAASHAALKVLKESIDPSRDWETQVDHALQAYLGCLASNPQLLRTLFIEILHLGPPGLKARRQMYQELADFIVQVVDGPPGELPGPQRRTRHGVATGALAMAIVGGINELVLQAIEGNRAEHLLELTATSSALVHAVLSER